MATIVNNPVGTWASRSEGGGLTRPIGRINVPAPCAVTDVNGLTAVIFPPRARMRNRRVGCLTLTRCPVAVLPKSRRERGVKSENAPGAAVVCTEADGAGREQAREGKNQACGLLKSRLMEREKGASAW